MQPDTIILTCLLLLPVISGNTEKNKTTFVPTREWQTVKKGTLLPEGLHVRHNFQTGVTEAKLMDSEEVEEKHSTENSNDLQSNSLTLHPEKAVFEDKDSPVTTEKPDLFEHPIKELKARLKKIKQDSAENIPELNDEHAQQIKQKFRDYETLKKELKALEINITTDSELLSNYFQKFQTHKNAIAMGTISLIEVEEVLDILHNLEYLLHHIDNAKTFTDMEGMTKIVSPCLNGTNNEIKAEALRLLGAAVQSNPQVQLKALENDLVQKILYILSTNTKLEVKSRCLFALSALIRQFPAAQKVWIDHGGVEIFGKILVDDQLQVQIKVMKLINDLIIERQNIEEITDAKQRQMRETAYAAADIEKKVLIYEYCKHLSNLMVKSVKEEVSDELINDEFLEIISESMTTITPICINQFRETKDELLPAVKRLSNSYQILNVLVEKLQTVENNRDEL
ncbi:sil1 nucleotide exchange factor isoform X1 [Megachile rotundata]|uniref:sil1 nucleotide exchange factor isoform X1 n=2 Tax=Megachile rotundata TaxID=143995 RepID=UPI00061516C5|nr:PREDICTED: nucleotide exchange factor SIL1 isoform X1 [Megachile rotundata]